MYTPSLVYEDTLGFFGAFSSHFAQRGSFSVAQSGHVHVGMFTTLYLDFFTLGLGVILRSSQGGKRQVSQM